MRWLTLFCFACAGCVDIFALPLDERDGAQLGDGGGSGDGGGNGDGSIDTDMNGMPTDGPLMLPPSCMLLGCAPTLNEGDVTIDDGDISGCHAYRKLTIGGPQVKIKHDGLGHGFSACADTIMITGPLSAIGEGEKGGQGPGAGKICGSGGSHGGAGADPGGCGMGATYGDPLLPRALGSGGGGMTPGNGGGALELAADQITLVAAFVYADGDGAIGLLAGGGAGGSILMRANTFTGVAQLYARGGIGIGIAGGGGGGGRIAVHGDVSLANIAMDVGGGNTQAGGADGTDGSKMQLP
jgi:hypothetical protein